MKIFSAFIVDDERLARDGLRQKLEDFPEIDVVGEASDIPTAMKGIESLNPELLFLDIQLSDGTGFDLLDKMNFLGKIIFITAYDKYAIRAFEINAFDYIMKPVSDERLKIAINRIKNENNHSYAVKGRKFNYNDRVMVSSKSSIHFIEIDTIVFIEASRDYTSILTKEGRRYLTSKSMQEWENRLPDQKFLRIHRSYIVNFDFIERTEKHAHHTALVFLRGVNEPIKLSRSYYKKIKNRYM